MKKKGVKRCIFVLAACAVVCLIAVSAVFYFRRITEPYVYPIDPYSEEWKTMSFEEQTKACDISPRILSRMTTPALVETVATYPFLGDVYLFDRPYDAFDIMSRRYAGINELAARKDAVECLEEYIAQLNEEDTWHIKLTTELLKYIKYVK